ncbi:hypothetical protein PHYPSEUDO_000829 [Phytophthora pseudosyringae]|uniref:Uncharacterized protein n=1 Tax=Phytophthora pseudosyringae TaxID=221518 RepID=A0A8T1WGV2_9STRA|nr:hypothetical protein PHYPSEUDO_000829 [Phytophthora pseudosyringae]
MQPSVKASTPTDSRQSPARHTAKKRKPTYLVRKEEEKALRDEALRLETQVVALQTQRIPATEVAAASVQQVEAESKVFSDTVRNQQLGVAAAQSLMLECSRTQYSHPLWSRICLKKDWNERRATLLAIREAKLQNAYAYAMARGLHTTDGKDRESMETFETDDGDICCMCNALIHFPGVQSLAHVFDALCFYLNNMEISISERLGHITVREDYDVIEGSAFNSRIISSDDNGVSTESNTIALTQLFGQGDPTFGGEPCAVAASDCVDEDELYPYRGSERIRKDTSGAIVLTVSRQQEPSEGVATSGNGRLVGVMRRTGMLKLHCPQFPLSPFAQLELEQGIADWGEVMVKSMRELLYGRPMDSHGTATPDDSSACTEVTPDQIREQESHLLVTARQVNG